MTREEFEEAALDIMDEVTKDNCVEIAKKMYELKGEFVTSVHGLKEISMYHFYADYCPLCAVFHPEEDNDNEETCVGCPLNDGEKVYKCGIEWNDVVVCFNDDKNGSGITPGKEIQFLDAFKQLYDRIMSLKVVDKKKEV